MYKTKPVRKQPNLYFVHLSCMVLVGSDSKLAKVNQVHYHKLHALGKNSSIGTHDWSR